MTVLRLISAILAVYYGALGAFMFAEPLTWYETAAGVTRTGPFNGHFVPDIGLIFLVSAACFGLWAWRPAFGRPLAAAGAAWPALHAVFHLSHWGHEMPPGAALRTEIFGIFLMAGLGLLVAAQAPAPGPLMTGRL